MRKLTLKRNKSFIGSLAKIQFYIEDEGGELIINEVPCRKIGELKNGEEAVFEIDGRERLMFAIADKLSRNFCNDCYHIPAGDDDLSLSGQCRFNPAVGNAFRFMGNDSADAKMRRKAGITMGITVLFVSLLVGALIGYTATTVILGINNSKEKVFSVGDMSVTLTEGFRRQSVSGFDGAFGSKDVAVFVTKQSYTTDSVYADLSVKEFSEELAEEHGLTDSPVMEKDGLTYFVFNAEGDDGVEYRYYVFTYKGEGAFWIVQFSAEERRADKLEGNIKEWAGSVTLKK